MIPKKTSKVTRFNFTEEECKEVFHELDVNRDGLISMNELSFVMRQPELFEAERGVDMKVDYVDDKVMDSMFRMADKTGEGQIDFDEFKSMVFTDINGYVPKMIDDDDEKEDDHDMPDLPADYIYIPKQKKTRAKINDVALLCKGAKLTLTKFKSKNALHLYNAQDKKQKKLNKARRRVFDAFCEDGWTLCNGRLLAMCVAGVLGQISDGIGNKDLMEKRRAEYLFDLLDIKKKATVSEEELKWMFKACSLFLKGGKDVDRRSQLLITAAGAKGTHGRIDKECFVKVLKRFPNVIFPRVLAM